MQPRARYLCELLNSLEIILEHLHGCSSWLVLGGLQSISAGGRSGAGSTVGLSRALLVVLLIPLAIVLVYKTGWMKNISEPFGSCPSCVGSAPGAPMHHLLLGCHSLWAELGLFPKHPRSSHTTHHRTRACASRGVPHWYFSFLTINLFWFWFCFLEQLISSGSISDFLILVVCWLILALVQPAVTQLALWFYRIMCQRVFI